MDEDNIDIKAITWRRDLLGDEPIYCAAPPPSDPGDIICPGSDDELDDDAKIAKRLRYETQGLRYLQGKPIRIFSAALHGPFEKASGWNNPWLPKQPTVRNTVPTLSQPASKPLPAIKPRLRRYLERKDATSSSSSSMPCNLPTPESNRELHLSGSPPQADKLSRIQAWAKDVSQDTILEKDAFWAPNRPGSADTDVSSKKRPAGKDWLKKQSKRKRPSASHDTTATSTPTPVLLTQISARCSSVPTNIIRTRKHAVPRKMASQSFEMTTPSSTANQSVLEAPYGEQHDNSTKHQTISLQANPSEILGPAVRFSKLGSMSRTASSRTVTGTDNQPSTAGDQTHGWVSNAQTQDFAKEAGEYLSDEQSRESQKADDVGSESYLDESFHYRTRPVKQAKNIEEPVTDACPEPTQTRTPSSAVHNDTINIAVPETRKPPCFTRSSPILSQRVPTVQIGTDQRARSLPSRVFYQEEHNAMQHGQDFSISPCSKAEVSQNQQSLIENTTLIQSGSVNAITPESASLLRMQSEAAGNREQTSPENEFPIPQAQLEENVQSAMPIEEFTDVKACSTEDRPIINEALLNDAMNIDGGMSCEAKRTSPDHQIFEDPMSKIIPTIELDEPMKYMEDETLGNEADTVSDLVTEPLAKSEWGVAEITHESMNEPAVVNESKAKIPDIKMEKILDKNDSAQDTLFGQPEFIPSQSPWVAELAPGADLTIDHVKSEPVDDLPSLSPCPSHLTLIGSQPSVHGTPIIKPSQQSPWGGMLLEPTRMGQNGHHLSDKKTIPIDTHPTTTFSQVHQSPWTTSNTNGIPYLGYPSLSPAPVIPREESFQTQLQLPTETVGLGSQCPEPLTEGPTTPPRIPTSHVRTPDLEKSIKSFAMFNSPSPKRQISQSKMQSLAIKYPGSIFPGVLGSDRSTRHVTFDMFPEIDEDDAEDQRPLNVGRVASPPPRTAVNIGDEDMGEHFQSHFEAMKRRAGNGNVRRRSRPLLPSASQQMPMSPAVGAMAEAFQTADAYIPRAHGSHVEDVKGNVGQLPHNDQSPWRKESQGVDDVADVMNNLDDFLNAWDVETELQKARHEPSRLSQDWNLDI